MTTHAASLAAIALLALTASACAASSESSVHVTSINDRDGVVPAQLLWQMAPADKDADPGAIGFSLGYSSPHNSYWMGRDAVPAAVGDAGPAAGATARMQISGLEPGQLAGANGPVAFTIHRDAGDFQCKGEAHGGKGQGTCVYSPNPGFASALAARGVRGDLGAYPQFELAMGDMGFAYVDELKRQAYATPDAATLVKAGEHGVSMHQLKAMDAAGYRFGDLESFIHVRDHGVSARYVAELDGYGLKRLPADDLVEMRDHGVSGNFVKGLKDAGYTDLRPAELANLRDHGVSASFVAELKSQGYARLATQDLVRLRDHGVSIGFISKSNQGGTPLSPDELIRLRDGGGR
jgi:hypothetical protein